MSMEKYMYEGKPIKIFKFPNNGIYINTKDLCNILYIKERPKGSTLSMSCLDLAGAKIEALKFNNIDFTEWLIENFSGYELETPIIINPKLNDDWDNIDDYLDF